ncbi:hypothetical protein [Haliangium sp.]|uniref:hypothetical protein n=1 Tax=Haliangium sp. TaxID=2663208 RepID=UPI003D121A3F
MTRLASTSTMLVLALVATGCPAQGDEEAGAVAVDETSAAMASSIDMVGVMRSFEGGIGLALLPVATARREALRAARDSLLGSVRNRLCVSVDTDEESYVEVTFRECPTGLFRLFELDGSLRADIEFDTVPCALGECPIAVRYTVSTPRLRMGARFGVRFVELAGSWSLYDPIDATAPTEWDSGYMVENHLGRRIAMSSRTRWVVDLNQCVTFSLDGELQVDGRADVDLVALSARGVTRCPGQCPQAGTVELAYGRGELLAWTYTGEDTALVTGPRGQRFERVLPCAEDVAE